MSAKIRPDDCIGVRAFIEFSAGLVWRISTLEHGKFAAIARLAERIDWRAHGVAQRDQHRVVGCARGKCQTATRLEVTAATACHPHGDASGLVSTGAHVVHSDYHATVEHRLPSG